MTGNETRERTVSKQTASQRVFYPHCTFYSIRAIDFTRTPSFFRLSLGKHQFKCILFIFYPHVLLLLGKHRLRFIHFVFYPHVLFYDCRLESTNIDTYQNVSSSVSKTKHLNHKNTNEQVLPTKQRGINTEKEVTKYDMHHDGHIFKRGVTK